MTALTQPLPTRGPNWSMILVVLAAIGLAVWVESSQGYLATTFILLTPQEMVQRLTPLFIASALIERAVEVLITPWRDSEAERLQQIAASGTLAAPVAARAGQEWRKTTRQIAFAASTGLGLCVSIAGFRGLETFANTPGTPSQATWFHAIDVVITAMVLGGGADGMHKLISLITDFLDATREKVRASAPPTDPATGTPRLPPPAPALPTSAALAPSNHQFDPGA